MSEYGWKPRKIESITCPSGVVVQIRRPGQEFAIRATRTLRTFSKGKSVEELKGRSLEEYGQDLLERMDDDELGALVTFARELVCAMLVSPRLVLNPNHDRGEVGPDDIENDFWFLFNYALTGFYNLKVPVGDGEVEVKDLETFRGEPVIQADSVGSANVLPDTESMAGHQGLVGSA